VEESLQESLAWINQMDELANDLSAVDVMHAQVKMILKELNKLWFSGNHLTGDEDLAYFFILNNKKCPWVLGLEDW
jgi:hypothetical protein